MCGLGHSSSELLIIGVSLSEPHASMTALRTRVCMLACLLACLLAWTDHLPKISVFKF